MAARAALTSHICQGVVSLRMAFREHDRDGVVTAEERAIEHRMGDVVYAVGELLDLWHRESEYRCKAGPLAPLPQHLAEKRRDVVALMYDLLPGWDGRTVPDFALLFGDGEEQTVAAHEAPAQKAMGRVLQMRPRTKERTHGHASQQVHLITTEANR